jgi:hypothetical protein
MTDPIKTAPTYNKDNISTNVHPDDWRTFQKKVPTRAVRVAVPFFVETSESSPNSPFYCEDGWLAVDARGYPYAIADDEFQLIYEEVTP